MSGWLDWIKVIQLKPRFLFGLWFLGGLVLLLPDPAADSFGIKGIRENFRGWIGIGTLGGLAYWLVQLIPSFQAWRYSKKTRANVIKSVSFLSPEERMLLAYCLTRGQQTLTLEITHRAAGALASKGLLKMATGVGNQLAWPFTIPDFLWEYLNANPDAIFNGVDRDDPNLQARFAELEAHIRRHD